MNDEHDSAAEQRFFSEPPEYEEETTQPSAPHPTTSSARSARPSSLAPSASDELEPREALAEDPLRVARRRQLQRRVTGALCGMLALWALAFVVRKRGEASELSHAAAAPPPTVTLTNAKPSAPPPATVVAASPPNVEIPAPPAAPAIETTAPADSDDALTLIRSARSLLNAGHTRDGVAAARLAVEKHPLEAEPYLLLAAGLQDLGDWHAAREVFAACLRNATRGANASCRYFARR